MNCVRDIAPSTICMIPLCPISRPTADEVRRKRTYATVPLRTSATASRREAVQCLVLLRALVARSGLHARGPPLGAAARRWHTFGVEGVRDRLQRPAAGAQRADAGAQP